MSKGSRTKGPRKGRPLSPKARPGNQNAAKPAKDRRVPISARVTPATDEFLRGYGAGDLGRNIDAAAAALRALDRHLSTPPLPSP